MAEPSAPGGSVPPPNASAGAPGFDNGIQGGAHMPPPPIAPLSIPQNTNPIPTALSSPMNGQNIISPTSAGGFVRRAAPEPNKRALYVGGLDARVTEDVLKQIFETAGHVVSVKIIPDKNVRAQGPQHHMQAAVYGPGEFQSKGLNYGFVEYDDPSSADRGMQTLNGRRIHGQEIRVNWAYQSNNTNKEDTSNHFHIFVGDLSNEVNDEILLQAFSAFGGVSEARVMWDMKTGRSRGYGFVAFRDRADAEKAISKMDGEWLGSRAIRCNWANQKGQPSFAQQQAMAQMGMTPTTPYSHPPFPTGGMQSYETVLGQSPMWQTTCYVGNLTPYTTQNDLVPLFMNFGQVVEARMQADRGFAFIKMESHEHAASAICNLNGYMVNGRPIKCSWGKDRPSTMTFDQGQGQPQGQASPQQYPFSPAQPPNSGYPPSAYPQTPGAYNQFQQYGGGMTSPQAGLPQGGFNSPYGQHPGSAGGFNRPPQGGQPQWPQHSGGYGNQYGGYQG